MSRVAYFRNGTVLTKPIGLECHLAFLLGLIIMAKMCFAGVIMSDETAESFIWTFTNFLKMVNNTSPKVFLTNEDQAIIKAVDLIFQPHGTKHALCLWHCYPTVN